MRSAGLTGDTSLGAVIAAFERTASPSREWRAALSHVKAELGRMPVRAVRARHVSELLDQLRQAGMPPQRADTLFEALRAVFAFARERRIVAVDPLGSDGRRRDAAPTPTLAMVALGVRVAAWTAWAITLGFLILLAVLMVELG